MTCPLSRPLASATLVFSVFTSPVASAEIDQVIVTATRYDSSASRVGDSVTVIDAAQARDSQKTAVSDLLTTTAGVVASRNGGLGATTTVRIRGAESDHTVALIDGVKLNDPSAPGGGFSFANLLVSDIARIEILRGAQSTLWGSQAIGGVVNIITPVPEGPLSAALAAEAGSLGSAQVTGRLQAGGERFAWRVSGNYLTTDGISAFDEDLGGREDDGYRNVGAHARGLWYITDALTAEVRSYWTRGRVQIDGFPPPTYSFADTREYSIAEEWVGYGGFNIDSLGGRLKHRLGVAYTQTDREDKNPGLAVNTTFEAVGRNRRFEYQGTWAAADTATLVFGAERERSELNTAAPSEFDPDPLHLERDVTLDSLYAQLQFSPARTVTLTGGMRYDDHEAFGNGTTRQAAAAWALSDTTTLRASYGEGFKAPTLFQLYSDFGTATLEPERAEDWDIGIEHHIGEAVAVSVAYFARRTTDLIDFVSCFGSSSPRCADRPFGYYENVQRAKADGHELSLSAQLTSQLSLNTNYTHVDARNDSPASSNFANELARRPRRTAYAQLSYEWRIPLTTTLACQYVGRSFDDAANTSVLDEYVLVDLRASYNVSERLEIHARVENLFDEDYTTTGLYGTIGRTAHAGFRTSF